MRRSSVVRSAMMLLIGMLGGVLLGFLLAKPRLAAPTSTTATSIASRQTHSPPSDLRNTSAPEASGESTDIVLGNITTVPFQELYGVLSRLSPDKLNELAAQLRNSRPGNETNMKVAAFFKAWAHIDPLAALRAAAQFKVAEAKNTAVNTIVQTADATQAESLAREIKDWPDDKLTAEQRNNYLAFALTRWADLDPAGAAKFFDTAKVGSLQFNPTSSTIARNWAAIDPEAALEWARTHTDGQGYSGALQGAIAGWWSKHHAAAEAYAVAHADTLAGQQAVGTLASAIYAKDPQRAKDWANSLPNLEARRSATSILALQMAFNDPKAAADWATTLPADVRQESISAAISIWANNDMSAAAEWISSLAGPGRDEATSTYASILLQKDPATAAAWAISISDAKIRDQTLDRIATTWMTRDANAATTWIQTSSLSDADKKRLLALGPHG